MSLINEALKRTRDATYQNATPANPDLTNYRLPSTGKSGFSLSQMIICGVTVVVLLAGITFAAVRFALPKPAPVSEVKPAPAPVPPPEPQITQEELMAKLAQRLVAPKPSAQPAAEPPPPPAPPPEPPKLALQGITSDGHLFEALINGVSIRVGESIEGARVVGIDSRGVRLTWQGQDLTLRLR